MGALPLCVTQGWDMIWGRVMRSAGSLANILCSSSASSGDIGLSLGNFSGDSRISSYILMMASDWKGRAPAQPKSMHQWVTHHRVQMPTHMTLLTQYAMTPCAQHPKSTRIALSYATCQKSARRTGFLCRCTLIMTIQLTKIER